MALLSGAHQAFLIYAAVCVLSPGVLLVTANVHHPRPIVNRKQRQQEMLVFVVKKFRSVYLKVHILGID